MAYIKQFTEQTHPNHAIIKAAKAKGLTGIVVKWYPAIYRERGWSITADGNFFKRAYSPKSLIELINESQRH